MTQWCADIYGPEFSPAIIENSIQNTNTDFGGYSYQGTNVMFVNFAVFWGGHTGAMC